MNWWKAISKDETWGYVLIVVGVVLLIWKPFNKISGWVNGQTEEAISFMLFAVIMLYLYIVFFGKPTTKALALLWIVSP